MIVSKSFNNIKVNFDVEEKELYFDVMGSCSYNQKLTDKVAITKWLLCRLKQAQTNHKYLYCFPYEDDNMGEYRKRILNKLGFTYNPDEEIFEWKSSN